MKEYIGAYDAQNYPHRLTYLLSAEERWYHMVQSIYWHVSDSLQRIEEILEYLVWILYSSSEFPNGIRPLCTTMPWTIWPALAVLWGVCWMFYSPSDNGEWSLGEEIPLHQAQDEIADNASLNPQVIVDFLLPGNFDPNNFWEMQMLDMSTPFIPDPVIEGVSSNWVGETLGPTSNTLFDGELGRSEDTTLTHAPWALGETMLNTGMLPAPIQPDLSSSYKSVCPLAINPPPGKLPAKQRNVTAPKSPAVIGATAATPEFATLTEFAPSHSLAGLSQGILDGSRRISGDVMLSAELSAAPPQLGSHNCPRCNKAFSRRDALKRHMRELKHIEQHSSPGDPKEFTCPHQGCKKSQQGYGFKRREKLEQHLKTSCKARMRLGFGARVAAPSSSAPALAESPRPSPRGLPVSQESTPQQRVETEAGSKGELISELRRRRDARLQESRRLEKEAADLDGIIDMLEREDGN